MTNQLYYGDNLGVLRTFPDACVDLVYLDPPLNSNAGYNVLFKSTSGAGADASIEAFDDTWTWGDSARMPDGHRQGQPCAAHIDSVNCECRMLPFRSPNGMEWQ